MAFGKYYRSSPLPFSFVPLSQLRYGRAKLLLSHRLRIFGELELPFWYHAIVKKPHERRISKLTAHHNTILSLLLKLVPRHEFEALARRFHNGRRLCSMTRWAQFTALALGQLSGRCGLRDVVANLAAQPQRLYQFGVERVARSSLARVNAQPPQRPTLAH